MAILNMKRFNLLTFEEYKEDLLKQLQLFENVHFRKVEDTDLEDLELKRDGSSVKISEYENQLAKIALVREKIKPYIPKPSAVQALRTPMPQMSFEEFDSFLQHFDLSGIYEQVKDLDENRKSAQNEQNRLRAENDMLNSWSSLDVSSSDFAGLKNSAVAVGTIGKMPHEDFLKSINEQFERVYVESLGNVKGENALMVAWLKEDEEALMPQLKNLGFSRSTLTLDNLPKEQVVTNSERIRVLQAEQDSVSSKIEAFKDKEADLEVCHDYYKTALERAIVSENFVKSDTVVVLEGWVPSEDYKTLISIIQAICGEEYYVESYEEIKNPDADTSEIPVKLKNNKLVSSFEDITSMYSTPKYNEIDPTPLLTPFYLLFFAIMIGDMGYGLVVTLGTFVALRYLNFKEGMRRMLSFFFYLGIATMLVGILFGGAFGITVFAPIKTADGGFKPILDSQLDIIMMLVMSVALGFVQIIVGLIVKGYMCLRDGKPFDAFCDSGLFLIMLFAVLGMVFGMLGMLPASAGTISRYIFFASLVGMALTQGRENPTIVGKIAGGIYGVYGLTSYIGDLVSYTRLIALSLSSAYIAYAFNLMSGLMPSGFLRIVFGTLIFLFGQVLNIALSLLSAYVHTCRLQYVEYFSKFYEGGGKTFKPLSLNNSFVKIKK